MTSYPNQPLFNIIHTQPNLNLSIQIQIQLPQPDKIRASPLTQYGW